MPGDWLVSLAGDGVVLPRLHRHVLLLGVDHGRTELHVPDTATSGGQGDQEGEAEGGEVCHDG